MFKTDKSILRNCDHPLLSLYKDQLSNLQFGYEHNLIQSIFNFQYKQKFFIRYLFDVCFLEQFFVLFIGTQNYHFYIQYRTLPLHQFYYLHQQI